MPVRLSYIKPIENIAFTFFYQKEQGLFFSLNVLSTTVPQVPHKLISDMAILLEGQLKTVVPQLDPELDFRKTGVAIPC